MKLTYHQIFSTVLLIDQTENFLDMNHKKWINQYGSARPSFNTVTVPAGHYLAMGDNRDNSADSRAIGFGSENGNFRKYEVYNYLN